MRTIYMPDWFRALCLALLLTGPSSVAHGAAQCSSKSYGEALGQMKARLLTSGYSISQADFLMNNADQRISMLTAAKLNNAAKQCGINSARAHVLGCLDKVLFPLEGSKASLDSTRQSAAWGKTQLARRELLFIGSFNACLETAKKRMFHR
ncbi:hypothetical protein [Mesorhizobium erdmanii]|uniref:hypothetical protein n=1 Tax=Mesorhizobium erdmanii TaxID=1777866 RepID=UPI0012B5AE4F|nr:hypothetical protein [Mesorhizobium erdmanii]